jgi:LETM1 and EF-hand domain-containing protein 1
MDEHPHPPHDIHISAHSLACFAAFSYAFQDPVFFLFFSPPVLVLSPLTNAFCIITYITDSHTTEVTTDDDHSLPKKSWLARTWETIKHEAHHYWVGTKLLGSEIGMCIRIIRQVLDGQELTRRELRQLRTTASDVLKAVPFSIFIIVPFMELALPLALWLFPGMLPSTFKQEWKKEEDMKKQLRARIEVAKFLQSTVEHMALDIKKNNKEGSVTAEQFVHFMRRVREGDPELTNEDMIKFSKLFTDDITLDTVGRAQLVNLCRLLDITPFGSDGFLKYMLIQRMKDIRADDVMIEAEGIDSLTIQELRDALANRGMRATGLSKNRYKQELKGWLELSLKKGMPISLLLMSRAFKITQDESVAVSDEVCMYVYACMYVCGGVG